MDAAKIALIQDSFAAVIPVSDETAAAFYDRLFAAAPEVRPLFTTDMAAQGRKLMLTLTAIVDGLDRLDVLLPIARELAVRHVRYGAKPAHYDAVGAALIATLRTRVGPAWTDATEAAWGEAYQLLAGAMIDAARRAA